MTAYRNADGTMKDEPGGSPRPWSTAPSSRATCASARTRSSGVTALFIREHNFSRLRQLQQAHPNWTGDRLYNAARAITTAGIRACHHQRIPAGTDWPDLGPYRGYNPNVNPNVSMEFSTVAFRVGHSQVSGTQTRIDNDGNVVATQSLADAFFNTPAQSAAPIISTHYCVTCRGPFPRRRTRSPPTSCATRCPRHRRLVDLIADRRPAPARPWPRPR